MLSTIWRTFHMNSRKHIHFLPCLVAASLLHLPSASIAQEPARPRRAQGQVHEIVERVSTLLVRSEEHTSELQSRLHLVCRLLLEKKKKTEGLKPDQQTRIAGSYGGCGTSRHVQ